MKITNANLTPTINGVVIELTLALSSYVEIKGDEPDVQEEVQLLDCRCAEAFTSFNDIISFVRNKALAQTITPQVGSTLNLISEILKEKTRILKELLSRKESLDDDFKLDDHFSLN